MSRKKLRMTFLKVFIQHVLSVINISHCMFYLYREFLPRGTGVVTRRPTIIQLHPSKEGKYYKYFIFNTYVVYYFFYYCLYLVNCKIYRLTSFYYRISSLLMLINTHLKSFFLHIWVLSHLVLN